MSAAIKKGGQGKREEEDRGLALESDKGLPNFSHIPRVFSNRIRREPPTTFHSVTDIIMRVKIVRTVYAEECSCFTGEFGSDRGLQRSNRHGNIGNRGCRGQLRVPFVVL